MKEQTDQLDTQLKDFIKIEKNLTSLGFFTASSKSIKKAKKKTISLVRTIDGKKIEASATILPSAEYGLPNTADQDTFFAILKIVTEIHQKEGKVTNPIGFTSAQILRLQGKSAISGYHYKELEKQLMRIKTTTIISENAIFLAGRKIWAKDAFNVIDRITFLGNQLPDGTIADKNYIWLSEWQIENINNNWLLPVDYENYKKLKSRIAKVLLPLLQIWLYATREDGFFEKRYNELCQLLNIHHFQYFSDIKRQLSTPLDEFKSNGYLANWKIKETNNESGYKIVFYHGHKFYIDRLKRIGQREQATLPIIKIGLLLGNPEQKTDLPTVEIQLTDQISQTLLSSEQELLARRLKTEFGISLSKAFELVRTKTEQTRRQLEAWPYREIKPKNHAGWMIDAIENNYDLPDAYVAAKEQELATARQKHLEAVKKACTLCSGTGFIYVADSAVRPCNHGMESNKGS